MASNLRPSGSLYSSDHVDYLQRTSFEPQIPETIPSLRARPEHRVLWHVGGIGNFTKLANEARSFQGFLTGLYSRNLPVVFWIGSGANNTTEVSINIGTWIEGGTQDQDVMAIESGAAALESGLNGIFPSITLSRLSQQDTLMELPRDVRRTPHSAFVMGVPCQPDLENGRPDVSPIDQVISAMKGTRWGVLILARPIPTAELVKLRDAILGDLRSLQPSPDSQSNLPPLGAIYYNLLTVEFQSVQLASSQGGWRTAIYLIANKDTISRLQGVWTSAFSSGEQVAEPIRTFRTPEAFAWAQQWSFPDVSGQNSPGAFRHPYQFQTLLNSSQLASYVHFPSVETAGFAIGLVPSFDIVQESEATQTDKPIALGEVLERTRPTGLQYTFHVDALKKHAFVAGVTGSGKTNTVFRLLDQVDSHDVPFLIVEPAKTEYRRLLQHKTIGPRLRIFTLGNEAVSPLRLNPFEFRKETPVGVHIDLLRSTFVASFGLWTPLPQILEQAMHRAYAAHGWDLTHNKNSRLTGAPDRDLAFPTLSDLAGKVDEVIQDLGYDKDVSDRFRGAMRTRINGLRNGAKGAMFDVRHSIDFGLLLNNPTVLELENMGDDDDKAFLMGLLFIRLVEHRRAEGGSSGLKHLLVIEEAHRLLSNIGPRGADEADPRGKAVESFSNMLSEIRAYGQGVVVADQVPVKLAPDVIKNTNLKIVHRVVAQDDRSVLAGSMAMDDQQARSLAILRKGHAVVFSELDDAPILVMIGKCKEDTNLNDSDVSAAMSDGRLHDNMVFLKPFHECDLWCAARSISANCQLAQSIVEDEVFRVPWCSMLETLVEDATAFDRMWPDVRAVIERRCKNAADLDSLVICTLIRAAAAYTGHRASQLGLSYVDTVKYAELIRELLPRNNRAGQVGNIVKEYQDFCTRVHSRSYDPFPYCRAICNQSPPLCRYRFPVANLIAQGTLDRTWSEACELRREYSVSGGQWTVCQDAIEFIVEWPEGLEVNAQALEFKREVGRRVGLCFAQQMLSRDGRRTARAIRGEMEGLIKEAMRHE